MISILGSGDPAFYHSDRDQAEAERELQIQWEDLQYANGEVGCRDCERPFDPSTMYDEVEGGLTFKICGMCGGAGAQSYRLENQMQVGDIINLSPDGITWRKEVIVRVDPQGAFLTKPVSAEKQYESSPIPVTNALGETL